MFNKIKKTYNPATLSGAHDIIVIEQSDGTLKSTPWHLRFGKLGLMHHAGKVISISINDNSAPFLMYVDSYGRGQFFASQVVKEEMKEKPTSSVSYPTSQTTYINIKPKDVRAILSPKTPEVRNNKILHVKCQKICRDSAVDLEAALDFQDPDPLPIETMSNSLDLEQSVKSSNYDYSYYGPEFTKPVPSALLLSSIRYLLIEGKNEVTFTVSSLIQGPKTIVANLYLWKSDEKIVISDVDGTVTKSDVLGHVLPSFGRDWTHPGLVSLYNSIASKGIKFIYLTSRPIGEAHLTRKMLSQINQNGQTLPDGPCITCPDLVIRAMHREIQKKPQEFKIPMLQDIQKLFPNTFSPFIFGFGNKQNDVVAYKEIGLNDNQIFLFDTKHRVMDIDQNIIYDSIDKLTIQIDKYLEQPSN